MRISDWSSDVCSSDLGRRRVSFTSLGFVGLDEPARSGGYERERSNREAREANERMRRTHGARPSANPVPPRKCLQIHSEELRGAMGSVQIGRASCGEMVCQDV